MRIGVRSSVRTVGSHGVRSSVRKVGSHGVRMDCAAHGAARDWDRVECADHDAAHAWWTDPGHDAIDCAPTSSFQGPVTSGVPGQSIRPNKWFQGAAYSPPMCESLHQIKGTGMFMSSQRYRHTSNQRHRHTPNQMHWHTSNQRHPYIKPKAPAHIKSKALALDQTFLIEEDLGAR